MATTTGAADPSLNKEFHQNDHNHSPNTHTHDHANNANPAVAGTGPNYGPYGGNPLARLDTHESARFPAFGGEFQPGSYRPPKKTIANPAPLGLSAFGLTTFVLSLINLQTRGVSTPNVVVALAFAYGGLVQLLAGMWEMAIGNTFGATALSSYGGFWIAYAILETPGGFAIAKAYTTDAAGDPIPGGAGDLANAVGFFLIGWWIFTTILLVCTLRSTVAFFTLFFTLDLAFLFLAIAEFEPSHGVGLRKAGGVFGLLAAFAAWYNALAGIADSSNSFFIIPVAHFPWSDKGREIRGVKTERETV
ncbi:GPR/FUN34 family protein (GPR1/FUN34/yaaH family protein) [Phlyctema vagabunda]|uniref:GPR/FUN34 family protein (GPR1/FUN34/yaaH family protein) n=1 Tax=Phlyctema vagabunda TaxID=108571 RepID=A0ABR4P450_9HELO